MLEANFILLPPVLKNTRILKFLFVGVLNTIVGYTIYIFCLLIGLHFSIAIAAATVLGTLFNFKSTGCLVFGSNDNSRLFRFIAVYTILYVLNVLGVGVLLHLGIQDWIAGSLLILPLALLSYILNNYLVFFHE